MLRVAFVVLLLTNYAPAQSCGCGLDIELKWPARMQRSDGSLPASGSEDLARHERVEERRRAEGEQSDAEASLPKLPGDAYPHRHEDLHVTALQALAISADGSTLRSGPHRKTLKGAVRWVRGQQDKRGRVGFSVDPGWMVDHAIVTTMLVEVAVRSRYSLLYPSVDRAFEVLHQHLGRVASVDVEVLVWVRMATAAGRLMPDAVRSLEEESERSAFLARLDALDVAVARFASAAVSDSDATDRRKVGAGVLLTSLLSKKGDGLLAVDVSWFDSYEHPLATAYYSIASFRAGGAGWKEMSKRLKAHLVETAEERLPFIGTWKPRGVYGKTYGRMGTTSVAVLALTFYYRYARLAVFDI